MFSLKPGTDAHKQVLEALEDRRLLSENSLSKKRTRWDRSDELCKAFMPERELDYYRKKDRLAGVPSYTTIQIPYAYSQLLAAHTYLASTLLGRTPLHQFRGLHGEGEMKTLAVESLIDYQVIQGEMTAPYYVWLYDALKYGVGIICEYWCKEVYSIAEFKSQPKQINGQNIIDSEEIDRVVERVEGYEGNKIFNVRPHDFLPDPRVTLGNSEKGEFVGRKIELFWHDYILGVSNNRYFNKDKAKALFAQKHDVTRRRTNSRVTDLPNADYASISESSLLSPCNGYEMEVYLIPKQWGLGNTELPEKWRFTVLEDKLIVEAMPMGLRHNRFSYSVLETEVEGYDFSKRGMLEIGEPLNDVLDWLVNSHFYNVRKTLNGDIVFDPAAIYASDVMDPAPGKRVRLRPEGRGRDVRTVFHNVALGGDVTQTHLQDTQYIGLLLQRLLGVSDNASGIPQQGGRRTATESRIASASSAGRLKTIAEYASATGFMPHAKKLIANTQQKYSQEKAFRIAGDAMLHGKDSMLIRPGDIEGGFGYVPVDGAVPIDRYAIVAMWGNLFGQIRNFPQVLQAYDMGKVFEWVAEQGGIRNIRQFRVQVADPTGSSIGLDASGGGGRIPQRSSLGTGAAAPIPIRTPGMDRSA
jgi:hypothetical protein